MLPPSWVKYPKQNEAGAPMVSSPRVRFPFVALHNPLRRKNGPFTTVNPPTWVKLPPVGISMSGAFTSNPFPSSSRLP